MTAVRPRALNHRGVIEAAGFLFDRNLLGVAEARRRVLSVWSEGARVFRLDDHYLICLAARRRVVCESALGAPLTPVKDVLLAAPLQADEIDAVVAPRDSVVLVRGGAARVVSLSDSQSESPADWLEIGEFAFVPTVSLGAPPKAPDVVVQELEFHARRQLRGVPVEAPELASVIAALLSADKLSSAPRRHNPGLLDGVAGALSWLRTSLANLFATGRRATAAGSRQMPETQGPSPADRLLAQWKKWAGRLLVSTRLSRLIGRQQAKYVFRMMEMFERGDVNEALRHAIPIDGLASALRSPSFRIPMPRFNLSIFPQRTRAGSSIYMADDLLSELRRLYRASFERLEAQGRIEEAAFVLAELLNANEEAVAFLERHGRVRLAAEMAEARGLAAGLIVRQWFIAGDRQRAIAIARRMKAFADAVMRLERTDKKEAQILRLLWAAALAEAGDYAAAVDVIWPVEGGRALACDWIDKAVAAGGAAGARMLARKASLLPEMFAEVKAQALALLEDEEPEGAAARASFATTLLTGSRTAAIKTLARAAVRAVLRDAVHTAEPISRVQYRELIDLSADGSLKADAPPLPVARLARLASRHKPLTVRVASADVGATTVHDLAYLPDGRTVAALGEAGVRLLARDGRTVAHFDAPAHRLVLSDNGDRAIAMARRGEVWKLARLDFLARRAEDWCEARVEAFASDYDGSMWFVACEEDFYAIDTTAKRFDALWRVPEIGGGVLAVARSASSCRFILGDWGYEQWHYELPALRLRGRNTVKIPDTGPLCLTIHLSLSAEGIVADQSVYTAVENWKGVDIDARLRTLSLVGETVSHSLVFEGDTEPLTPAIFGDWCVAPGVGKDEARATLIDVKSGRGRAEFFLERAGMMAVRLQKEVLCVGDDRGRLLVMELRGGQLLRNMRV